ncbi:SAM-dependent methyltransferase [Candidatus Endomicrobiellum trichonymphae]|uniref:SAM-dependent methyltransferase n=2 Tax=Endomicrobium trichonymphae TaxID=1408204 RepID=B1GZ61_ENDTX|nr:SAM-dependent methyltransferase [Candidatus Endomicrobium trichonymphae]
MDTKGNIENHSKIKLSIYEKYLKAYLSIMMRLYFTDIFIVEPFAGKGISNNGEEGSAIIAKNVITSISNSSNKNIHLVLNDIKKESYVDLIKNLKPDGNRVLCFNKDANEFINDVLSKADHKTKTNHLFFIDPWGYTQLRGDTYQNIFKAKRLDILIFIPINHIYRFLIKEENSEQLKPIAGFLNDMGIAEEDARKCQDEMSFVNEIKKAFTKKADTDYVYYKELKNTKSNNKYALFFLTKHILGAEKFLEALVKIKEKDLFENTISDEDLPFIENIHKNKSLTNCELYEYGILHGLLPKKVTAILNSYEKDNKITVMPMPEVSNRKKGNFYISYKNKEKPKIKIVFK